MIVKINLNVFLKLADVNLDIFIVNSFVGDILSSQSLIFSIVDLHFTNNL